MSDGRLVYDERELARVRAVDNDGRGFYAETKSGKFLTGRANGDYHPQVEQILLVSDEGALEVCDPHLWEDDVSVGVVRGIGSELTLIETGATLLTIPTVDILEYRLGNTVQYNKLDGVRSVVVESPISLIRGEAPGAAGENWGERKSETRAEAERLSFDDFGGSEAIVERAREIVDVIIEKRQRFWDLGAKPIKGVLFSGPSGVGKTYLASIIADQANAKFYVVNGPEFFGKYVGEAENRLKELFDRADANERSVVFFDEFDSVATSRSDEMHEVSRRVISTLLAEMDGVGPRNNTLVIAATNRPENLDSAVMRPGRFDWHIQFSSLNAADRLGVLRASSKNLKLDYAVDLDSIAEGTEDWSAADLAAIWREAVVIAVRQGHSRVTREDFAIGFERASEKKKSQSLESD